MVEEVFRYIYRIEIPLPRNPLRIINANLVKGEDRNLPDRYRHEPARNVMEDNEGCTRGWR
jgi:hypothetical protein